MALDRFVYWKKKKRPSRKKVKTLVEDFFKGLSLEITEQDNSLYILLPGKPHSPWARLLPSIGKEIQKERWIEVYIDTHYVDVITRLGDHITNVLAEGLTQLLAQYLDGRCEK